MKKIILNCFVLLCASSAFADYVPSISIDTEGIINRNYYRTGIVSTSAVKTLFDSNDGMLFGDVRISRTSDNVNGIHLGFGLRTKVRDFTVGFNSFYDHYIAKKQYDQYVAGIEVFHDIFKLRNTIYYPLNNTDTLKGIEIEGRIKIGSMFLSAKPYYFFGQKQDAIKGIGVYTQYNRSFGMFHAYAKAGYQFDNYFSHQATVRFGMQVALSRRHEYQFIEPVDRNMFFYKNNLAILREEFAELTKNFMSAQVGKTGLEDLNLDALQYILRRQFKAFLFRVAINDIKDISVKELKSTQKTMREIKEYLQKGENYNAIKDRTFFFMNTLGEL